jgi:hypothetical protein
MDTLMSVGVGGFFGFFFGIGCSLVVLYAIYLGGYRRAVADSLITPMPENYRRIRSKIEAQRPRPLP